MGSDAVIRPSKILRAKPSFAETFAVCIRHHETAIAQVRGERDALSHPLRLP